jgi:hypothetical protein
MWNHYPIAEAMLSIEPFNIEHCYANSRKYGGMYLMITLRHPPFLLFGYAFGGENLPSAISGCVNSYSLVQHNIYPCCTAIKRSLKSLDAHVQKWLERQ